MSWSAWTTFSVADGLAASQVNAIVEDREGVLWFGTAAGLSRYDGAHWKTYTTADGLAGDFVTGLMVDRAGSLWASTDGGVGRFDGTRWNSISSMEGGGAIDIAQDSTGAVWFAGTLFPPLPEINDLPLWRYDGSAWRRFTSADGLPADGNIQSVFVDRAGSLWVGTGGNGACRYDGTSWRAFTTADGLASDDVTAITEDAAGNIWCGFNGHDLSRYDGANWTSFDREDITWSAGLCPARSGGIWVAATSYMGGRPVMRYDGYRWRSFGTADGLASGDVMDVFEDHLGAIWVGTFHGGVSRFDGASWKIFAAATDPGFTANGRGLMLEDHDAGIWVATPGGGVSRYDGTAWRTFTAADGLSDRYVNAMVMDRTGAIWAATYGGVSVTRDHATWQTFTTADGVASDQGWALLADRTGSVWLGTAGQGVSRYDGNTWTTFTRANGMASSRVSAMLEDRDGRIWAGAHWFHDDSAGIGVSRYDGSNWEAFGPAEGMTTRHVHEFLADHTGAVWCGGMYNPGGLSHFDGNSWRAFGAADGLAPAGDVRALYEDRRGNVWVGTSNGTGRYDGTNWRVFTPADGLSGSVVYAISEDRAGALWFATEAGVSRFEGDRWTTFTTADGLWGDNVTAVLEDSSGAMWFGTYRLTRYYPDRVPPRTLFTGRPPSVSANSIPTVTFAAGFKEIEGIEFSYRLDGEPWSAWTATGSWPSRPLADGTHVIEVEARDALNNLEPAPARAEFEIDAAPPIPVIVVPASAQAVRDSVRIRGTANDVRFASYRVEVGRVGAASRDSLFESASPVADGVLCAWNTAAVPDGEYELRLSVRDTLGLTGTAVVRVIVDNHEPWAVVTSPALLTAAAGGDVYTTNAEAHLYVPPRGLEADAVVTLAPLDAGEVPAAQGPDAQLAHPGYRLDWGSTALQKAATLEMSCAGIGVPAGRNLVLYAAGGDSQWRRLGGTLDPGTTRIALPVTAGGRYALYTEPSSGTGSETLSDLSLTPRVLSARGGYPNSEIGIGFTLGRAGSVTVKVYNRAGRLVRDVVTGDLFGSGANLVRWDGRDRAGAMVEPGLYVVTVAALGETQSRPVAVVQ